MSAEDAFAGRDLALAYAMRPDVAWATSDVFGMSAALRLMPIGSRSDSRHKIGDPD